MDIENGTEVFDKNGKRLGKVERVIRDTYTTEIKRFSVSTDITDAGLFFSPEEVEEATSKAIKLNIGYDEGEALEVKYGAEVVDKNEKEVGTVDYTVKDSLTGKIRSFKVNTRGRSADLMFSTDDVLELSPTRVKLKVALDESDNSS
jgi:sporulation protein YlmC with PRC-barrel domain